MSLPKQEKALTPNLSQDDAHIYLQKIIHIQSVLAKAHFNLDEFMDLIVTEMQKLTPATGVVIGLVENEDIVYRAVTGTLKDSLGLHLPIKNSISGLCVQTGEVLYSNDTENDSRVNAFTCQKVGARSLVVGPLFYEGKTIGVLKILSDKPEAFGSLDIQTLELMAGFIGSAIAHQMLYEKNQQLLIERTQAYYELEEAEKTQMFLAQHDYLTRLPNRSLFNNRFQLAIKHSEETNQLYALVYLDIDHFKLVNDNLGHSIGDELLKAFAIRLQQCIRSTDTVARLGGDEFLIILKIENPYNAILTGKKIIERMRETFTFQGQVLNITTSIGITYFQGEINNPDNLIVQADQALYYAKRNGRNNYKVFNQEIGFF